ncbi:MAG: hypothetical protein JST35_01175 [Armatimonadetes bacterium]|nr:hypothetical protein [Armatimonadota bacterium]
MRVSRLLIAAWVTFLVLVAALPLYRTFFVYSVDGVAGTRFAAGGPAERWKNSTDPKMQLAYALSHENYIGDNGGPTPKPQEKASPLLNYISAHPESVVAKACLVRTAIRTDKIDSEKSVGREDWRALAQASLKVSIEMEAKEPENWLWRMGRVTALRYLGRAAEAKEAFMRKPLPTHYHQFAMAESDAYAEAVARDRRFTGNLPLLALQCSILFPHYSTYKAFIRDLAASTKPDDPERAVALSLSTAMMMDGETILDLLVGMANTSLALIEDMRSDRKALMDKVGDFEASKEYQKNRHQLLQKAIRAKENKFRPILGDERYEFVLRAAGMKPEAGLMSGSEPTYLPGLGNYIIGFGWVAALVGAVASVIPTAWKRAQSFGAILVPLSYWVGVEFAISAPPQRNGADILSFEIPALGHPWQIPVFVTLLIPLVMLIKLRTVKELWPILAGLVGHLVHWKMSQAFNPPLLITVGGACLLMSYWAFWGRKEGLQPVVAGVFTLIMASLGVFYQGSNWILGLFAVLLTWQAVANKSAARNWALGLGLAAFVTGLAVARKGDADLAHWLDPDKAAIAKMRSGI